MTKHTSIAAALSALQGDMPTVKKTKTVRTGKYSYTYADLASVMEALAPHLKAHGLAFSALPVTDEHGFRLEGHLMHESGERLTGSLPLNGRTPQEIGSALTYARRYLLGCLTGVVTDEDDDGQLAQAAGQRGNSLRDRIQPAPAPTVTVADVEQCTDVDLLRSWWGNATEDVKHAITARANHLADLHAAAEQDSELVQGELIEEVQS